MLNFLLTCLLSGDPIATVATPPPNIVIVYVDDMGVGGFAVAGCHGLEDAPTYKNWKTVVLALPTSPSRSRCARPRVRPCLTGCYPNRIGIHGALGPVERRGLA